MNIDPNPVTRRWSEWCNQFHLALEKADNPLYDEASIAFLGMSIIEQTGGGVTDDIKNNLDFQIMQKRAHRFDLKISDAAIAVVASMACNRAGAVMYTHYLKWMQVNGKASAIITVELLAPLFPAGFMTESQLFIQWNRQKFVPDPGNINDNMLDTVTPRDMVADEPRQG